jgi:hypothetical protein
VLQLPVHKRKNKLKSLQTAWDNYLEAVPEVNEEAVVMSKANFFAGAAAVVYLMNKGADAQSLINEIEVFAIDCPTFITH